MTILLLMEITSRMKNAVNRTLQDQKNAPTAETLMRRYSAYATAAMDYLIKLLIVLRKKP
jgi:uncharacterized protein YchJ